MKRFLFLIRNILLVTTLMCAAAGAIAQQAEFCWKDSYGRGVGTIPTGCNEKENQAGLCYARCNAGMTAVGPVCWSQCPSGYTDHGAICHINLPLTKDVSWVCTAWFPDWLGGECRWKDSRCPSGYTNVGLFCALDSAGKSPPPGFSGTYLDPMKNSYGRGAGTIPTACDAGKVNDAGLCYSQCNAGYNGVGPVCWGTPPALANQPRWVECGMGAAKDSVTCAGIVFGQVSSVGQIAFTIATAGGSSAAASGANSATKAGKLAELKAKFAALKTAYENAKKGSQALQAAEKAAVLGGKAASLNAALTSADGAITEEDIARASAQIASIVDGSGVSAAIGAYTYPKCSKYFGPQSVTKI